MMNYSQGSWQGVKPANTAKERILLVHRETTQNDRTTGTLTRLRPGLRNK